MNKLCICLDLGNSSLKIGFGVMIGKTVNYGKITEVTPLQPSYFPSTAYFDEETERWYFGAEIDKRRSNTFSTIVRIKDMLSLLLPVGKPEVAKKNREYYFKGKQFPKFLFPPIPEVKENGTDLGYLIRNGYSFESPLTPQRLCEEYFSYVAKLVKKGSERIGRKFKESVVDYSVSLIYPNNATKDYTNEYVRLIEKAFKQKIDRSVSSTRALVYYAKSQGKVGDGDEFLVFDIGDESISVSKAALNDGAVMIDGIDGHLPPLSVGGNDIDENIVNLIESKIERRETIGSPSFGEEGHVTESGLNEKNYLLTRNVKDAKVVLSSDDNLLRSLTSTPVDVNREVFFQVELSKKELNDCSGVSDNNRQTGVAARFADYIAEELSQVINRRVNKILIAGGVIETSGLFGFIRSTVSQRCNLPESAFLTFEREENENDSLGISETEDSSYAAALGGCYLSLFNIPIRICLPLTFATNYADWDSDGWYARLFAGKGTPLAPGKTNVFSLDGSCKGPCTEEIYSLQVTEDEIKRRQITGVAYCNYGLLVYNRLNDSIRERAQQKAGLKVVLTNRIVLTHNGRTIQAFEPNDGNKLFLFREGIRVDEDGHAEIFIEPRRMGFSVARVFFDDGWPAVVSVSEIEIGFEKKTIDFDTNTGR